MKTKTDRAKSRAAQSPVRKAGAARRRAEPWNLRLYVAGQTPRSLSAYANLKHLCETHLPGRYTIEVIDLTQTPQLAQVDQILALPTLVRKLPTPVRRVIGDLSDVERVMVGIDLATLAGSPTT